MKGLTVKKLAAIAAGAVLVGTALAPIVTAIDLERSDIYNANGTPAVDVVVGAKAAVSDAVWAGNIAAKIASKAATSKNVTTTVTGGGSGTANPTDLSVDLAVGGTVTYGAGSKQYKVNLNSAAGASEIDANVLTSSQLTNLYNTDVTQKVAGTSTTVRMQEKITVTVDAKFDKTADVKDLVGSIGSSQFRYTVDMGTGTSLDERNYTYYTDSGSTDNVKVVFFGNTYELKTADYNSGTKSLKLVKSSAKETYNEGQTITGLKGRGTLEGQDVSVKAVQITQSGPASGSFNVTLELYDASDTKIDTQTVASGTDMAETFVDSSGNLVLSSNLFVDTIALATTTSTGYIEITKGTDTVMLYDASGYPYDSSNLSGPYKYKVALSASGLATSTAKFTGFYIYNSSEYWESGTALHPTGANQSLTGAAGTTATFGSALAEGTAGKGFAKVDFQGFEGTQSKTTVKLGKITGSSPALDDAAYGGAEFSDTAGGTHRVPFALALTDGGGQSGSGTFKFDGATIAYRANFGGSKTGTRDVNITVLNGDLVNGRTWTVNDLNGTHTSVTVSGVGPIGLDDQNWRVSQDSEAIDGVTFKLEDANAGLAGGNSIIVSVDTNVEFQLNSLSASPRSNGTYIYSTGGDNTDDAYGQLFLTNDSTFDSNASKAATTGTVGLYGSDNTRRVYYAARFSTSGTSSRALWLVLDDQNMTVADTTIQYSKVLGLKGTGPEGGTSVSHYSPDSIDFASNRAQTNTYYVAEFFVDDALDTSGGGFDFNVLIDTRDGGLLGNFPNDQLTGFAYDVNYAGYPGWMLRSGAQSDYMQAGITDIGTKASIDATNNVVSFVMPQNREQVIIYVIGKDVTTTVTGEEIKGLAEGDTGTTSGGTNITISKINYAAGDCAAATGGICTANPANALTLAGVSDSIVVLDTFASTGRHIIVGGHMVNQLAADVSGLAEQLNAEGDFVADKFDGDIVVAGYTADDTGDAAQELIDAIDGMNP